jgi:hypothetical protein
MSFLCEPLKIFIGVTFAIVIASIVVITPALAADGAPPYLSAYVAVLTGLLGFIGSWIGAQIGLTNFKRQRAFDKRLEWYERAFGAVHSMAEKIQIACTSEANKEPPEKLNEQWRDVQLAHRVVDRVSLEAPLYGTYRAIAQMKKIARTVQEVADKTEAFDPPKFPKSAGGQEGEEGKPSSQELLDEIEWLGEHLEKSLPALVGEGRKHLGINRRLFWNRLRKPLGKSDYEL